MREREGERESKKVRERVRAKARVQFIRDFSGGFFGKTRSEQIEESRCKQFTIVYNMSTIILTKVAI